MGTSHSMPALQTVKRVDVSRLFGAWFVIAVMPTPFERGAHSAMEVYTRGASSGQVAVDFTFTKDSFDGPLKSIPQSGSGWDGEHPANWKVSPFWPLKMPYLVIDASDPLHLDAEDAYFVVGYPSRAYVWVMARKPEIDEAAYTGITERLVEKHSYPKGLPGLIKVPHKWTRGPTGDWRRGTK